MTWKTQGQDLVFRIHLNEVNHFNGQTLQPLLEEALATAKGAVRLIMDLSEVGLMQSLGLSLLARLVQVARHHNWPKPVLVGVDDFVQITLETVALDRLFDIQPSMESAGGG